MPETWLNGWPRLGEDAVLIGTGVHCVGCGRGRGITCVVIPADWEPPARMPDWPFPEDACPVCTLSERLWAAPAPRPPVAPGRECRVCGGTGERPMHALP
jgi:hypothetical protein